MIFLDITFLLWWMVLSAIDILLDWWPFALACALVFSGVTVYLELWRPDR